MDYFLFHQINSLAGQSSFFDWLVWFFSEPLGYLLLGLLALAFLWPKALDLSNRFPIILAVLAAIVARFAVKNLIVFFYNRPRPFDILEVNQLVPHEGFASFPSGHAIFFFTLATVLILYNRSLGYFLFAGAILMGLGRITAGLHWPSDILAGASLGILVGVLTFILYEKISKTNLTSVIS